MATADATIKLLMGNSCVISLENSIIKVRLNPSRIYIQN